MQSTQSSSNNGLLGKGKFLVPNLFTSLNFLLGVWAILLVSSVFASDHATTLKHVILGANLIVWCVLFDKLDGFAARLMKASSEFGAQFDSLADLIAFGLAPSILVIFSYKAFAPEWYAQNWILVLAVISLYVLCTAIRLARYNAIDSDGHPDFFVGMPSTMAGGAVALLVILFNNYGLYTGDVLVRIPILFTIFCALMMVSPFLLPKVKRRKNKVYNLIQVICLVLGYITGIGMILPEFLFSLVTIYFIIGFSYGFIHNEEN